MVWPFLFKGVIINTMNNFYVYTHSDPITKLVRYVGRGCVNRSHVLTSGRNSEHKEWIASLKIQGLKPVIEYIETNLTFKASDDLERLWIAAYKHAGMPLVNKTSGGQGVCGLKHSSASKDKMSTAKKGKAPAHGFSAETRAKISAAHTGMKYSPESYAKMAAAKRANPPIITPELSEIYAAAGRKNKGNKRPDLAARNKDRAGQLSSNAKQVIDLSSGIVFDSARAAADSKCMKYNAFVLRIHKGTSTFRFVG